MYEQDRAREMAKSGELTQNPATGKPQYRLSASEHTLLDTNWTDIQESDSEWMLNGGKNPALIKRLMQMLSDKDELILDFFAGSCTTAQAVLELNREDQGSRHFIVVQLPEPTPRDLVTRQADYPTIADIGKERIRRVIAKMREEQAGKLDLKDREQPEDLGFKVYKLTRSHFRPWQPYQGESTAVVQQLFNQAESPLVERWQPAGLLVEIMLQEGFPLDSAVARQGEFAHNAVERVSSEFCEHRLFVCLDARIVPETAEALPGALRDQDVFVCLDQALTDEGKMRLADRCNLHVI